jgi:photosystem II stability/assembly factor-like uncharacterized protein
MSASTMSDATRAKGAALLVASCIVAFAILACDRAPAPAPAPAAPDAPLPSIELRPLSVGTDQRLQAVSVVDRDVVWASGVGGTVAHSTDGGNTWDARVVPGAVDLQFRDLHAVSADVAYLLAAGEGERSRILKTTDGGETWREQWRNTDPRGFFDCFDFWSPERGLAVGDSVDGKLQLLRTENGETWQPLDPATLPDALPNEGAFAASGTCLVVRPPASAWIGTGTGGAARVWSTHDGGASWEVATAPIHAATPTSGIASLVFFDDRHGLAAGGDVLDTTVPHERVALTSDAGRTWTAGGSPRLASAVYGTALVHGLPGPTVLAVGPGGADLSRDGGRSWMHLADDDLWAAAFGPDGEGWAVGAGGKVLRVVVR